MSGTAPPVSSCTRAGIAVDGADSGVPDRPPASRTYRCRPACRARVVFATTIYVDERNPKRTMQLLTFSRVLLEIVDKRAAVVEEPPR